MSVAVSIVSHGHGKMVWDLIDQVLLCPEVNQLMVTINIPEPAPRLSDGRCVVIVNDSPKGFGANHNAAFQFCEEPYFCALNPDIKLTENPFPALLSQMVPKQNVLVAPRIVDMDGLEQDSMRKFLSLTVLFKRLIGVDLGATKKSFGDSSCYPEWVGGMFMLFKAPIYKSIGGFDERYFMYCEDTDICTRIWKTGNKIIGCLSVSVIHDARRASRTSAKHLLWHAKSIVRYLLSYAFSLPKIDPLSW